MTSIPTDSRPPSRRALSLRTAERRAVTSFRRRVTVTVVILTLVCAGLVVFSIFQGPKLQGAQIDTARSVAQPNQQLRLFANEAVTLVQPGQVTVSPAAQFTTTTTGRVISVQFRNRLLNGTRYSVTVSGVTSVSENQKQMSTFGFSFTTDAARVLYLDRADPTAASEKNDAIIRTGISRTDRRVVYEARHIQSFVDFGDVLAVVLINDDHTNALVLVGISDQAVENIVLPGSGASSQLALSENGILGFRFSSAPTSETTAGPPAPAAAAAKSETEASEAPIRPRFDKAVLTINLASSHIAQPILGLDGHPLLAATWFFIPGGLTAAILGSDESLWRVTPGGGIPPVPLGQYAGLMSAAPDGTRLVVSDPFGPLSLDLATGVTTRLPPSQLLGVTPYGGSVQLLDTHERRVQEVVILDSATGTFTGYVVLDQGTVSRILYQNGDRHGNIEQFSVSPNGQYVAVSVVPDVAASVSDKYFAAPESTSITTLIVDIASGKTVRTLDGFGVSW